MALRTACRALSAVVDCLRRSIATFPPNRSLLSTKSHTTLSLRSTRYPIADAPSRHAPSRDAASVPAAVRAGQAGEGCRGPPSAWRVASATAAAGGWDKYCRVVAGPAEGSRTRCAPGHIARARSASTSSSTRPGRVLSAAVRHVRWRRPRTSSDRTGQSREPEVCRLAASPVNAALRAGNGPALFRHQCHVA